MLKRCFSLVVGLLIFSAPAWAYYGGSSAGNVLFGIEGMRLDHNDNFTGLGNTQSERINTYIDVDFGYTWSSGFYTGATYSTDTFATNSAGTTTTDNRVAYGATLGYHWSGFYLDGTYIFSSTYTFNNGNTMSGGSAYFAKFGYDVTITGNFYVGAGLVYKSFSWGSQTVGSVTTSKTNNETDLYPSLNLGFMF